MTSRYLARLGLESNSKLLFESTGVSSIERLRLIVERHLAQIPFENTAQHGVRTHPHGVPTLDLERTAHKLLDLGRGGFCFELNGLLATWLEQEEDMKYTVCRVPAVVYRGHFDGPATHMALIVHCHCDNENSRNAGVNSEEDDELQQLYYVDVGLGEPPLQPLAYGPAWLGKEQTTCEGMRSRLDLILPASDDDDDDNQNRNEPVVQLSWYRNGKWVPRLQWSYAASLRGAQGSSLTDPCFHDGLAHVLRPSSNFSQKLICCRLTRDCKLTMAGHRLKTTQPRGFGSDDDDNDGGKVAESPIITEVEIVSNEEARRVLETHFGIPWPSSEGLNLDLSRQVDPDLWSQM